MQSDNLRYIVEADAKAFYVVDVAGGNSVEFLEDVFLVFFGDADAVVGNLKDGIACFGVGGDCDTRLLLGVFDGVVNEVVHHVGYVQVVGKQDAVDRGEVRGEASMSVLDGELETLCRLPDNAVQVDFFWLDGELFARHLGTLQKGLYQHTHTAVLVADDIDEVAPGGQVAGDTLIFQHLAGKAYGGDGRFYLVGHVVDEVGLHLVEFMLGQNGADGKHKEGGDKHYHADADDGVEVGVAAEDDGRGWEGEYQVEVLVGCNAMGVESVFERGGVQVVRVGSFAAIEKCVGIGPEHPDGGCNIYAVDDELFPDEGVEQWEVELGGLDGTGDAKGIRFGIGCFVDAADQSVAGVEEGIVLGDAVLFGRGEAGVGQGEGTVLCGDTETDALLVVEEVTVLPDDVLHLFVHVVNAAVAQQAVALFLRHIVFHFHLLQLVENLVYGVVYADVEKVVAHLGRLLGLGNLDNDQPNGRECEYGGKQYEKTSFHAAKLY